MSKAYFQQLKEDQAKLQNLLEERRHSLDDIGAHDGDVLDNKRMRPSVRMLHEAYVMNLEDGLKILNSLIDYFEPQKAQPRGAQSA